MSTPITLTSLLLVEERLLEAQYFVSRLGDRESNPDHFKYELNAFLTASRSATLLLQKEMKKRVPRFDDWWEKQRDKMRSDAAMKFFHELRNYSQHEGRIEVAGAFVQQDEKMLEIRFFIGLHLPVPGELQNREVWICCGEHLAKLASIVLLFAENFPSYACPHKAMTPEGMRELGLSIQDILPMTGFPRNWLDSSFENVSESESLRILRNHFDGIDFDAIREIAGFKGIEFTPDPDDLSSQLSMKITERFVHRVQSFDETPKKQQ